MSLESEISQARRQISSDGYPMSIGELTNMYKSDELIIRPEFQRFFRWSGLQKSRLVESLLLGIPLPSIFVSQTDDGIWELVDGLQRISTILELQGELADADTEDGLHPQLILAGTKYLPSLEGKQWDNGKRAESLTSAQRLDIKRAKIDVKIIKRDSSPQTKFDLFQRLNSYGSPLNSQELRSALLVAVSSDFFAWLENLSRHPSFVECVGLSDRLIEERYDLELVTRFLVLHNRPTSELRLATLRDLPQVLDDSSAALAARFPRSSRELQRTFFATFDFIQEHGSDLVFKRWDISRQEFRGSFLNTAFEIFGLGLGYHIRNGTSHKSNLLPIVRRFWAREEMQSGFATGRSTEARLVQFIPLGRQLLAQ